MDEDIKYLSIPIEEINFSKLQDDRIAKLTFKLMHSSENNNKSDITLEAINNALADTTKTIVGMPILAGFNSNNTDVTEHVSDEQVVGIIPQINNNLYLEKEEGTDRTYVYVDGYIYTYYSQNIIEIFEKAKDYKKGCSIEIEVLEGYNDKERKVYVITNFKYLGVTILGDNYGTGMVGTTATLTYTQKDNYINKLKEFNEILTQYFKEEFIKKEDIGKGESIKIDLSKESADMSEDWSSVDKSKLRNDLLSAKNYKACVNACYLVIEDGYLESTSTKLSYPVCKISDGKLILSKSGCESALSFLNKNTSASYYKSAKAKLKRYYKKLDLSTENFSEDINNKIKKEDNNFMFNKKEFALKFGLTTNQLYDELCKVCSEVETFVDEYWQQAFCRYSLRDYDAQFIYARDYKENKTVKIPYSMEGDNPKLDINGIKRVKTAYIDWEDVSDENGDSDNENEEFSKEQVEFVKNLYNTEKENAEELKINLKTSQEKLVEVETNYSTLNDKFSSLEKDLLGKDEVITIKDTEIESLKEFKVKTEQNEIQNKANNLFTKYNEYLTDDDKENFNKKLFDFAKFEDFEDKIKAFVLPKVEAKNIALSQNKDVKNTNTIDVNFMNLPIDNPKKEKTTKSSIELLEEYIQNN